MSVKITVIGTGAIGTSIGLALKAAKVAVELTGHDRLPEHARQARKMGAFDRVEWNLIRAVESADMIVLAVPAGAILPTLQAIRDDVRPGTVITDTAAVKGAVATWAAETLPDHVHFVGGHPLVHLPGKGPRAARADLFQGHRYCVVPAPTADEKAVEAVVRLVAHVGASPFFLDAAEHDVLAAGAHQLPALALLAVLGLTSESPSWKDLRTLASDALVLVNALVVEEPADVRALFFANRQALAHWIGALQEELGEWLRLLREEDETAFEERVRRVQERQQELPGATSDWHRYARAHGNLVRMLGVHVPPPPARR